MTGGREAIEKLYSTLIVNGLVVNSNGDVLHESNDDAFAIDIAREMGRPLAERELPVFVANINGQTKYILALRGAGLWGPIWGYVALNDDFNTIFGVFFSHTSETPGLGSQIAENEFQNQFVQKVIMNNRNELVSVAVMKEGARDNNREQVDAITGGTITSKAVETMLFDGLQQYNNFLQQRRNLTEGGTE
jgi:Na+-transporting NADH:ubiquinone oxidoreductase subunit C